VFVELLEPGASSRYADVLPGDGQTTHVVLPYLPEHGGLMQKEACFNIAEKRAPESADVLIWIDSDTWSRDAQWWTETRRVVELNGARAMVQAFRTVTDADNPGEVPAFAFTRTPGAYGQPGLAWACHRAYWREMGGINPYCISGSGDVMLLQEVAPELMSLSWSGKGFRWWAPLIRDVPKARVCYADVPCIHEAHGKYVERAYLPSRAVIDMAGEPVKKLVSLDENGLLQWTKPGCPLALALRDKRALADDMMGVARRVGLVKRDRLQYVTEAEVRKREVSEAYWAGRWEYISAAVEILRNRNTDGMVLEVGTAGLSLVKGSTTMDIRPGSDVEHDGGIAPWPFHWGQFAACIALQVIEHVKDRQTFFREACRVAEVVVLSVPWEWVDGPLDHRGIDMEDVVEWTGGAYPIERVLCGKGTPNPRMVMLFVGTSAPGRANGARKRRKSSGKA